MFNHFDRDKNQELDIQEFGRFIKLIDKNLESHEIRALFDSQLQPGQSTLRF